ncbi:MAG: carboxypeptidase-like regulatory domain-containing protein, partial [Acidobacteriota bacterium]
MLLRAVLFRAVLHRAVIWFLLLSAWPAMVAAAGIPIVGQVLDPDGEPRSKVAVHLEPIPSTYERAKLRLGGQPGPEPVASTRTGSDGTFEIAAPEQGMWKVVASPRGMLTVEFRLIPLVEAAVLPAVKLTPAADLEVRLIDEQKQPLSGRVGATALNVRGSGWRPQLRLATAGDDGVARLPLGRDEKIQLEILADGHPLRVYEVIDESSVEIKVPAGVAGTVRVTDREKRSLEGAIAYQGSALLPLGMSDAEGQLPLVLQADRIRAVRMVTAERWHGSFELDFAKSEGKVESLRLEPPVTLRGRVLDTANRDPVGGAVVWAVRGELAVTDARGGYALDMGAYKSRWVQGVAAGYQPGRSQVRDGGATETPAIALAPAASLSGRVVDADGAPIGGVAIDLTLLPGPDPFSPALQRMRAGWRGTTSSGGTFQVTGLAAGVGYQLEFERAGFAPRRLEVEPLEPFQQRAKLEVVLRPGRLAVGRVVDEDDVPVASAEVVLELPPPTNDLQAMIRTVRRPEDEGIEPSFLTDGEGRFEIPDLAAGRYDLAVRAAGFAPAKVPGLRISQGDGRVDFGTVVLVPGAVIEGRVIDADGAAVAEVEITADLSRPGFSRGGHKPGELGQARSGQDGRFAIVDLLPDQALNLTATKKGYGIAVVTELRPPTSEPVVIELHPAGQMVGKVVDERDRPIPRATVSANPDHRSMTAATMSVMRRPTWARTDEEGLFAIEDVGPGTLEVNIHAEGYQRQMRTGIEVAAGAVVELEVVLRAGSVVEGLVTTEEGKPVARASVNATERTQSLHGIAGVSAGGQTDVEGRYRFEGAPIGAAMINVRHQNRQIKKNVELRPGTNVVDLVLEGGFTVTGQVVTPDGSSVGGAAVAIQESVRAGMHFSFGSHSKVVSNAAGLFTLEGITEGQYVVTASREGWAPARSEPFEVSNDVTGLLLELSRGSTLEGQVVGLEFDELGSLSLMAFSQAGGMRQGRVDFEARYAFDDLAPGQWNITAQVAGSGRQVTLQVEIPEGVGQVEKNIEFGTGFTLTGIVLDGERPLAGVNVSANSATGGSG